MDDRLDFAPIEIVDVENNSIDRWWWRVFER